MTDNLTFSSDILIEEDIWLSNIFGCSVYKINLGTRTATGDDQSTTEIGQMLQNHVGKHREAMYYVHVDTRDIELVRTLCDFGMYVVDVNVTHESDAHSVTIPSWEDSFSIGEIRPNQHQSVVDIASTCFKVSRFHLDPLITTRIANQIKNDWIQNYIDGKRGEKLLVACLEERPVGFLAVLTKEEQGRRIKIIDLTGVNTSDQGQGIGRALASYFIHEYSDQCDWFRVGTQISNIPAMALYTSLGFAAVETKYLIHMHVKDGQVLSSKHTLGAMPTNVSAMYGKKSFDLEGEETVPTSNNILTAEIDAGEEGKGNLNILFGGHGKRGVACLNALVRKGYTIACVLTHPLTKESEESGSVAEVAKEMGLPVLRPVNVNDPKMTAAFLQFAPDLIVLAGYGQIVKQAFIDLAEFGCINLHGGILPQYRGSSPMNWALINGEREFGISITQVDTGVDTGNVLDERIFPISNEDTIVDLHSTANRVFPEMLLGVLAQIENGTSQGRIQDEAQASYWPLRFPADGLILWDTYTADQIHNRIRALTEPYPCAFTFFKGQRVKLLASRLNDVPHYGDPGRIYAKRRGGILVCASDRCLWIQRALIGEAQEDASHFVERYDKFATMRDLVVGMLPT